MQFWNFVHDVIGMHVYELFCAIVLAIMIIVGIVHSRKQKKRALLYERELLKIEAGKIAGRFTDQEVRK